GVGASGRGAWIMQQDSAPAHQMKATQALIRTNVRGFISPKRWPAYSPDLNPLDYAVWGILKQRVYEAPIDSRDQLIARIRRCWFELPKASIDSRILEWHSRLRAVAAQNGYQIELLFRNKTKL